ncbi:hypothetical protein HDR63_01445 [bacterium]|nr:hypothetical protein [bacterium]
MSSWSEKTGAEKAKDILFMIMLAALGYYGYQDLTQRRERRALRLDTDNFHNREVAYIDDLETQQTVLEKTGKLFVLPGAGGNHRIFAFLPIDEYVSPELNEYVENCVHMAKQQIANEAIQAANQTIRQNYPAYARPQNNAGYTQAYDQYIATEYNQANVNAPAQAYPQSRGYASQACTQGYDRCADQGCNEQTCGGGCGGNCAPQRTPQPIARLVNGKWEWCR